MIEVPESMESELGAWNDGAGIDLESWIGCEGRFALAVGYAALFWPEFVLFEGCILRAGFSEEALRGWERQGRMDRPSLERMMNHLHIGHIQHRDCTDAASDKFLLLGKTLKEIYEAKLSWQFPNRPCRVELYVPAKEDDLDQYQLSFWQKSYEEAGSF